MLLRAREFKFRFPRPVLVMGVLNVTPDSFSDGGEFLDPGRAAERAIEMVEQGAEIIDIGGESSRPGSRRVSEQEELRRVMPVGSYLDRHVQAGRRPGSPGRRGQPGQ
jgi:dihydropteroate synthase